MHTKETTQQLIDLFSEDPSNYMGKHPYNDLGKFNGIILRLSTILNFPINITPEMLKYTGEPRIGFPIWVNPDIKYTGRIFSCVKITLNNLIPTLMKKADYDKRKTSTPMNVLGDLIRFRTKLKQSMYVLKSSCEPESEYALLNLAQCNIKAFINYYYGRFGQHGCLLAGDFNISNYVSDNITELHNDIRSKMIATMIYADTDVMYFTKCGEIEINAGIGNKYNYETEEIGTLLIPHKKSVIEIREVINELTYNDTRYTRHNSYSLRD